MAKEIDVQEAPSWNEEEAAYNIKYLEDRNRYDEAQAVRDARGNGKAAPQQGTHPLDGLSAQDVMDWVGEDVERAAQALDYEGKQDEPRKGLSERLTKMVEEDEDDDE